jgi:hypothetical protein
MMRYQQTILLTNGRRAERADNRTAQQMYAEQKRGNGARSYNREGEGRWGVDRARFERKRVRQALTKQYVELTTETC